MFWQLEHAFIQKDQAMETDYLYEETHNDYFAHKFDWWL